MPSGLATGATQCIFSECPPVWRPELLATGATRCIFSEIFPSCFLPFVVTFYWRNLPHWHPGGKNLFISWRLHATIADRHWLARPDIAQIVVDTLAFGEKELRHYELIAWVVMSNHVHALVFPYVESRIFMKRLKGFSARKANALLHRTATAFWQREYFDHWIRSETECQKTIAYIESNPVRAGVAKQPADFRWSSAHTPRGVAVGRGVSR